MSKINQLTHLTCFSPRIKRNLEEICGYFPESDYIDVKSGKVCWVYKRTNEMNMYLAMSKYNYEHQLDYQECQIWNRVCQNLLFPNTNIEDYDVREVIE